MYLWLHRTQEAISAFRSKNKLSVKEESKKVKTKWFTKPKDGRVQIIPKPEVITAEEVTTSIVTFDEERGASVESEVGFESETETDVEPGQSKTVTAALARARASRNSIASRRTL